MNTSLGCRRRFLFPPPHLGNAFNLTIPLLFFPPLLFSIREFCLCVWAICWALRSWRMIGYMLSTHHQPPFFDLNLPTLPLPPANVTYVRYITIKESFPLFFSLSLSVFSTWLCSYIDGNTHTHTPERHFGRSPGNTVLLNFGGERSKKEIHF